MYWAPTMNVIQTYTNKNEKKKNSDIPPCETTGDSETRRVIEKEMIKLCYVHLQICQNEIL